MGNITYGLWIHVAPGNDWRFEDIKAPGAVRLSLDSAATPLSPIEPPALARAPYQPVASWGATAYFGADLELLRRMAARISTEPCEAFAPIWDYCVLLSRLFDAGLNDDYIE